MPEELRKEGAAVPAIRCEQLTFRYFENSAPILEGADLTIPAGKITVLMGSSGCGKSTLAAVMCGLLPENGGFLTEGKISLFGEPLDSLRNSDRARLVSMMFQNPDLQFCMATLREELYFCQENLSIPAEEMKQRAEDAARRIGSYDYLDRPLHTLSGGEKQRAVLTCIYLLDAGCILLDEPFANLDPASVREMMSLFDGLCHEQGKTIVAIDHMSDHWIGTADRFVLLGKGGSVIGEASDEAELAAMKPAFLEQGVAYPGIWKETAGREHMPVTTDTACLRMEELTIPVRNRKPARRKKRQAPVPEADALLWECGLSIHPGQITAILGPSGCGKTTLMMALLKQTDYRGRIVYQWDEQEKELGQLREEECFSHIGIAFQNPSNQFITQNVTAEVEDGLNRSMKGATPEQIHARAIEMLDTCGLKSYQKYSPYMLSQGQQRRLAVLSVLAAGQKLLLLDEPTYGQDYRSARALMDQISRKVDEEGLAVIMTTHDAGLAEAYADVSYQVVDKKIRPCAEGRVL